MGQQIGDVQELQQGMAEQIGTSVQALQALHASADSLHDQMASSLNVEVSKFAKMHSKVFCAHLHCFDMKLSCSSRCKAFQISRLACVPYHLISSITVLTSCITKKSSQAGHWRDINIFLIPWSTQMPHAFT